MSKYLSDAISNLLFFTADGYQIEMQKEYNVSWEIIPNDMISQAFIKNPKGYFMRRPMVEYVDAFENDNRGIVYYKHGSEYKIETEDVEDYILSNEISLIENAQYNLLLSVPSSFCAVLFYDKNGNIVGHYDGLGSTSVQEYKFSTPVIKNMYPSAVTFKACTRTDVDTYAVYSGDTYLEIIVEDGGLINPDINMYTRPADEMFLFDPSKLTETNEAATGTDIFRPITNEKIYDFNKDDLASLLLFCFKFTKDGKTFYESNYLKLTIINGSEKITETFNIIDFFRTTTKRFNDNIFEQNISYGVSDLTDDGEHQTVAYSIQTGIFTQTMLKDTFNVSDDFSEEEQNLYTTAFYVMQANVGVKEFPYVHYQGSVLQEPVSTDFISTKTVFILNEVNGELQYPKITINDGNQDVDFRLVCRFKNNSETTFITSNDDALIEQSRTANMPLKSDDNISNEVFDDEVMHFTVGFQAQEEGCYQNPMGMFLRNQNTGEEFFVGILIFKNEAVGEDERFRTLMTNFGIPDPIKYPNIFAGQDIDEESTDWTVVNEKSKELFMMYDEIFPYVGTYKALLNAIKFLGYQDLIFKEWYKIKDSNDKNRYVAIQTYNTKTGENIENVLKKYGVTYGEYERYTKLNRLSMVYHMEEISDESEAPLKIKKEDGTLIDSPYYDVEQIPALKKLYNYRTDEVLAKLYSVKKWIESYITGINCYISDINGEGIVLERIKVLGYVTENHYKDIQNIGYFTPNAKQDTEFLDSSAIVNCSLNEFTNVTFSDYADYPIDTFIKEETVIGNNTFYISTPLGAMTVADEYSFELHLDNSANGSLYEFSKLSDNNTIIVNDSELTFFDYYSEAILDKLPIMSIKKGNIRRMTGDWRTNVEYVIKKVIDPNTLNVYYNIVDIANDKQIRCKGSVILSPQSDSTFKYSANNQWKAPVFIMKNFKVTNQMKEDKYNSDEIISMFDNDKEYIIEIIEGEMMFRNNTKESEKDCDSAIISFSEPNNENESEQQIYISYEYKSERQKIYDFIVPVNMTGDLSSCLKQIEENTVLNTNVKIPVNRLGNYQVSVRAYDAYNNIFMSKDDDTFKVSCRKPDMDIILNSSNSNNKEDFYKSNIDGSEYDKNKLNNICDYYAKHPLTYAIYDSQREDEAHTINYNVITYAIDTPKKDNYVILTNMTECVQSIESDTYLIMKPNNLGKQNIYVNNGFVDLVLYDDMTNEIIHDTNHIYAISNFMTPSDVDPCGKLWFSNKISDEIMSYKDKINDPNSSYNLYVISANEIDLRTCVLSNDSKNHLCYITSDGNTLYQMFNEDMVVKVCVSYNDNTSTVYNNQVAARILEKKLYTTVEDDIIRLKSLLVLDTEIDINYIDSINNHIYSFENYISKKVGETLETTHSVYKSQLTKIILKPLHQQGVVYKLRVVSDAIELSVKYYNNEYNIMTASFKYLSTQMLFDDYFDDSYALKIYDYDPRDLDNIWFDYKDYKDQIEKTNEKNSQFNNYNQKSKLYAYRNHPVTIEQDRFVIIKSADVKQLDKDYKTDWKWYSYLIEDTTNWKNKTHNIAKTLVFNSLNNVLTVRPQLLGPQSIEMRCIDKYGNIIKNDGGGNIFIK